MIALITLLVLKTFIDIHFRSVKCSNFFIHSVTISKLFKAIKEIIYALLQWSTHQIIVVIQSDGALDNNYSMVNLYGLHVSICWERKCKYNEP